MKREDLTKLGLTDDAVIDKIMALHGSDIEAHKTRLTAAEGERDGLKSQLDEATRTIDGFKALNIDQIKAAADEWKAKAEKASADAAAQVSALKFDHALEAALTGEKAKNMKAVKALLQMDALKLNEADGSILGLKEQLEKVKADNDYLFTSDNPDPTLTLGGGNQPVQMSSFEAAARKGAGLPTSEGK